MDVKPATHPADQMMDDFYTSWFGSMMLKISNAVLIVLHLFLILLLVAFCLSGLVCGLRLVYEHWGRPTYEHFLASKPRTRKPRSESERHKDLKTAEDFKEEVKRLRETLGRLRHGTNGLEQ